MGMEEKQNDDALENELQALFDSTVVEADAARLNRLARFSADIPKEAAPWVSPFLQQMLATGCLVLGLSALSASAFLHSPQSWSSEIANVEQESHSSFGADSIDEDAEWDSDVIVVGFDLLHGTQSIDAEILEDSFQALLDESSS